MMRTTIAMTLAMFTIACADAAGPTVGPPSSVQLLPLVTFDGSGQAVHPDAAITPVAWGGSDAELFATPYPNGDASKENPSLYTKRSMLDWFVPDGVMNPIARPDGGYLSDPDQVFNPETSELWLYYRAVNTENQIFLIKGAGPTAWSAPTLVVQGVNHTIVSPTVVRRSRGDWLMWSVNSGTVGCTSSSTTVELRRSADGVTWSAPTTTDLTEPDVSAWHIDVQWIPTRNEFWAIYNVKVPGSCTTAALHFATSADGEHWNVLPGPALSRGVIPAFADIVYRSSVLFDASAGSVTLWYSGARFADNRYTWRVATETLALQSFLDRVATPLPFGTGIGVTSAPPLTNADAP
jgi:hypothetical protein